MRYMIIYTLALTVILMAVVQPATGVIVTGIPFLTSEDIVLIKPLSSTGLTIEQFNSSSMFTGHTSDLSISFPLTSNGIVAGSTLGPLSIDEVASGARSSNILPFGLVDVALPHVSQNADDRLAYERTYFFTDTF